jgi:hypothetical protein
MPQTRHRGFAGTRILREAAGRRWGRSFRAHEVLAVLEGLARNGFIA